MMSILQKTLLGLGLLVTLVLAVIITSKKINLEARNNALLLEMVANISNGLDKLDNGFNLIAAEAEMARGKLRKLAALHRENLMVCALMHEKHRKTTIIRKFSEGNSESGSDRND